MLHDSSSSGKRDKRNSDAARSVERRGHLSECTFMQIYTVKSSLGHVDNVTYIIISTMDFLRVLAKPYSI